MHRIVFLFFVLSGFSSLVFEVIWARMLQQVFGTTSFAVSTLLTAFMAGLALGSWIGGKLAARIGDQLRLYGVLEASVGAYALVVPLMLDRLPTLYGLLFEHFIDDFLLFSLLRFIACFAILVVPTTLMGATLPLVSQWISDRQRLFQGSIAALYGANTLGACLGCFLAGFVLLPGLGLSTTNGIFAGISLTLGAIIIASSKALRHAGKKDNEDAFADLDDEELSHLVGGTSRADHHPRWSLLVTLVAFGITGAIAMSYQVLWTRAYLITLGSSTYSFTLVLTTVLAAIALGSAVVSPFVKRIARPLFWFAIAQFGVALSAAFSFFTLNRVPLWLFERIREPITGIAEIYFFQFGLVALVVFLPSFLQGMCFPLVIRAVTDQGEDAGSDVGNAYAFNTAGAIVGSFAAGFILMPQLGLQHAVAAVIVLNLVIACALALVELRLRPHRRRQIALALAFLISAAVFIASPPLDQARLTSGVFRAEMARDVFSPRTFRERDPEILYYEDGLTATTSVERIGDTTTLKANGKPEASDGADMPTQVMVGLLPFIIRSGYDDVEVGGERAAMIGFGSGVTAGASLQWPLQHLEVVEIESTMIEASRYFEHVNHRPLDDPRLTVVESDGRNYLEYTPRTFDVIISEPSNPWIAGVSSLFTVEFFERARQKLNPGGVYAQWVQLYEMRPDNVRAVFETFRSVFPHVHAYSSRPKSTDLILIGSDRPLPFPPEGYERAWEIDSVEKELRRIGVDSSHQIYGLLFMNQLQLEDFSQGATKNTDDNGLLEFSAPRDVIFHRAGQEFFTDWYFQVDDYGDPRPYLEDWPHEPKWTPRRVAALARSTWVAGKPELTAEILRNAGYTPDKTSTYHVLPGPIDPPLRVVEATEHSITDVVDAHWPDEDTELRRALLNPELRRQMIRKLEDDAEKTPAKHYRYALLLTLDRQFRRAERQFDRLATTDSIAHDPVYHFARAEVLRIRRRYTEAYDAFLNYSYLVE